MFLIDKGLGKYVLKLLIAIFCVFDSVRDQYKSQEMCDKAVDDNVSVLEFVPDQHKTQEMCIKAVDDYTNILELVPDRLRLQKCVIKLFPKMFLC